MIPELRKIFNARFSHGRYHNVIAELERRSGTKIEFRIAETPVFLPLQAAERAARLAEEILIKAASAELQKVGAKAIPAEYEVADETPHPKFAAVDFAICGSPEAPEFKLIELQGFPSLYHYQPAFSECVRDIYELPKELNGLFDPSYGIENYYDAVKRAILGTHSPNDTVLLEIDPHEQKTRCDFYLARKHLGISIVDIRDVTASGRELFYPDESGTLRPIRRIYNRSIVDELVRRNIHLSFDMKKSYDVEWAGHPNWYFRISKVLLPHLVGTNEAVPQAYYVSDVDARSLDLSRYVLKPLYSFAGLGVNISPTINDVTSIAEADRSNWLLQEKVEYSEIIHTPDGNGIRAELRVLLVWGDDEAAPKALHTLNRLTRGKMIGVDFNKGLDWVGSSCSLVG